MKKLFLLLILVCGGLHAGGRIAVNNRILTKVNNKTISVLDVMKKMNVIISRHFPQIENSPEGRYQFYSTQWKDALLQMVDQELMIADAEKIELKIPDSDIREKLQERFGPNVVDNLEKIGISYEEAKEMIRTDLVVQRMTWYRVNSKALLSINPQDVKVAYRAYCENNASQDEWKYQTLSIRAPDEQIAKELSEKATALLNQGKAGLAAVAEELKSLELPPDTSIAVSQELSVPEKDLSESHKTILTSLDQGAFSQPIEQKSRSGDKQAVKRIFQLKEHVKKEISPFDKISNQLEDQLIENAINDEMDVYLAKIRQRFGFDPQQMMETIPSNFQPFVLTQ